MLRVPCCCGGGGKSVRGPELAAWVMVTWTASALAAAGTPQLPASAKTRVWDGCSAGPPSGPAGLRVSISRQGERGENLVGWARALAPEAPAAVSQSSWVR